MHVYGTYSKTKMPRITSVAVW